MPRKKKNNKETTSLAIEKVWLNELSNPPYDFEKIMQKLMEAKGSSITVAKKSNFVTNTKFKKEVDEINYLHFKITDDLEKRIKSLEDMYDLVHNRWLDQKKETYELKRSVRETTNDVMNKITIKEVKEPSSWNNPADVANMLIKTSASVCSILICIYVILKITSGL